MASAPAELNDSFFQELVSQHRVADFVDVVNVHGYPETWDNDRMEFDPALQREWLPEPQATAGNNFFSP